MSRLLGQEAEILKLSSPVAFAKGVHIVHVAHDRAGGRGELPAAEVAEKAGLFQPPVNIGHAGLDELAKLELTSTLVDLDGAKLPRPVVGVLKEMAMDGPQVAEIKAARGDCFGHPLGDRLALDIIQASLIGDSEAIDEDVRAWIDVGIASAHSAASGMDLARM